MEQLPERCPVLKEMISSHFARSPSGERVPIHSNISLEYAQALYETVRRSDPAIVLEVGMAFGISSLAILAALHEGSRNGKLISIDPAQSSDWKGCGRAAVVRAGYAEKHELIEDFDYHALPRLLSAGLEIDFAYIDGWHTFDYTLIDWWYIDKMLAVDGIVAFNDCSWRSVNKVIGFALGHRKYIEIDVGLPVTFAGYSRKRELLRRLSFGRKENWYRRQEDRYLKKTARWEPKWDFFAPF